MSLKCSPTLFSTNRCHCHFKTAILCGFIFQNIIYVVCAYHQNSHIHTEDVCMYQQTKACTHPSIPLVIMRECEFPYLIKYQRPLFNYLQRTHTRLSYSTASLFLCPLLVLFALLGPSSSCFHPARFYYPTNLTSTAPPKQEVLLTFMRHSLKRLLLRGCYIPGAKQGLGIQR